jgi:hypothetical protein
MSLRYTAILSALAIAASIAGCAPTEVETGTKVKANLSSDTAVNAASIDVGVQKKVVTLTGTVDTASIKEQALVIARRTEGVDQVVDQLVVRGHGAIGDAGHSREMMGRGMGPGEHAQHLKDER